jgi:Zn-dependent protease with chaperone function
MHIVIIAIAIGLAWFIRAIQLPSQNSWLKKWQRSLFLFLFPPLILLMTAASVLLMGPTGEMLGMQASWCSYILCVGFIFWAAILLCKLGYQGYLSQQQVRIYPQELIFGKIAHILNIDFPYIAQIGFWDSKLIISQGLIDTLDREHLQAVLAHEQAHYYYRDTFWFFWLGWIRTCTCWLPNTKLLWQELLLLREIRADLEAAKQVDALLIAESLLVVTQKAKGFDSINLSNNLCAAFSCSVFGDRLTERIDALLSPSDFTVSSSSWLWIWVLLTFLPLVTVPFHYYPFSAM